MKIAWRGGITVEHKDGVLVLDPTRPTSEAFVSHAHSDHHPRRGELSSVHASEQTLRILEAKGLRVGNRISLGEDLPSGHIVGSRMLLVEVEGRRLLYTGDFSLSGNILSPPPPRVKVDILIMDATYGVSSFVFPDKREEFRRLAEWIEESDRGALLNAYSVGKSQEVLVELARILGRGFLEEVQVSSSVCRINDAVGDYVESVAGVDLSDVSCSNEPLPGKRVFLTPSGSRLSRTLGWRIPRAQLSGWVLGSGRGFVISDHADFPQLMDFVRAVDPEIVVVAYGFKREFSSVLRFEGYEAYPLEGEIEI